MIGKIELPLLRLAMLVSDQILFPFTELNKYANIIVSGVSFTERDIM